MKSFVIIFNLFLCTIACCQEIEKEVIYLHFDLNSSDECETYINGKGVMSKKFRKEKFINFFQYWICNERFFSKNTENTSDVIEPYSYLNNKKVVNIEYLQNKFNWKLEFKHHVFKDIIFFEKLPNNKIKLYHVVWNDSRIMVIE